MGKEQDTRRTRCSSGGSAVGSTTLAA
uniref:Uncharacterized protein n=1 Tax=Arundo donax TaxID=35708 RepID=A0A0A9DSA4_ARUDO